MVSALSGKAFVYYFACHKAYSTYYSCTLHTSEFVIQLHAQVLSPSCDIHTSLLLSSGGNPAVVTNLVPVQITVPAQQAGGVPKAITIHVPSTALANGVAGMQLQAILSSPTAAHTFALEVSIGGPPTSGTCLFIHVNISFTHINNLGVCLVIIFWSLWRITPHFHHYPSENNPLAKVSYIDLHLMYYV